MLERGSLRVREPGADGSRLIEDAATGAELGTARPAPRPWWLPLRSVLEIRETGDAPLVFTLRRGWPLLLQREVRDAEGRPVGRLLGPLVEDAAGRRLAILGPDGSFRRPNGVTAARLTAEKGCITIRFEGETDADPFGRMLLLAAVLQK
jgi:hypothetical protein